MKEFQFYQECKCTIWYRDIFSVEADTLEEAVKQIEPFKDLNILDDGPEEFLHGPSEFIYETVGNLCPEENDGQTTKAIYTIDGKELFCNGR